MKRFILSLFLAIMSILPIRAQLGTPNEFDAFFYLDFYRYTGSFRYVTVNFNGETILNNKAVGPSGFDTVFSFD